MYLLVLLMYGIIVNTVQIEHLIVAEREPRWVFRVNIVSLGTEKEIGTVLYCIQYVCMYVCMYVYCSATVLYHKTTAPFVCTLSTEVVRFFCGCTLVASRREYLLYPGTGRRPRPSLSHSLVVQLSTMGTGYYSTRVV